MLAGGKTTTYGNDELGRRTLMGSSVEGTTTHAWNDIGQLGQIVSPDATATYSYGISGMREMKVVGDGSSATTTTAFWSGMTLLAEKVSDGTTCEYVYGPGGMPLELIVGEPGQPEARFAYMVDHGGSVVGLCPRTLATLLCATSTTRMAWSREPSGTMALKVWPGSPMMSS